LSEERSLGRVFLEVALGDFAMSEGSSSPKELVARLPFSVVEAYAEIRAATSEQEALMGQEDVDGSGRGILVWDGTAFFRLLWDKVENVCNLTLANGL
jgi:hypothetical protein